MSIQINERVILNSKGEPEITVDYQKMGISIFSGYCLGDDLRYITFETKHLKELIDVLQSFLKERGRA
jgi:hypothetical protein